MEEFYLWMMLYLSYLLHCTEEIEIFVWETKFFSTKTILKAGVRPSPSFFSKSIIQWLIYFSREHKDVERELKVVQEKFEEMRQQITGLHIKAREATGGYQVYTFFLLSLKSESEKIGFLVK